MTNYDHKKIEEKWQNEWEKEELFFAKDSSKKPKHYVLIEFPYPSGEGLHMGHLRPFLAGDVYSRFMRMTGHEVMYPIGWDAFGLPAENFAIKNKVHPKISTAKNIENAKRQLKSWGTAFDWSRELNTTDPKFYKWTQWIFLQFHKAGLAYESTGFINWCPKDKTGLANEEVIDGCCERCGTPVEKKEMKQWYLKITAYAEKLLEGLKTLNWPEQVKIQQENWIGKSEGAEIDFSLDIKNNYLILPGWTSTEKENYYPWLSKKLSENGNSVKTYVYPRTEDHSEEEIVNAVLTNNEFNEHTVIIAHSLGCVVTLKVLERLKQPIAKIVLTGGFLKAEFKDKPRAFDKTFKWKFDFKRIKDNVKEIVVLHDIEDFIVPEHAADELADKLNARLVKFKASQPHIKGKEEPEVLNASISAIKVFTTRPDTIFGATYMVLAPEHPLVNQITTQEQKKEVAEYVEKTKGKTDLQRSALEKEKTGVFTGSFAINPATKEKIPVWIADYVLMGYGTGAIMAVPQHDERDRQFAEKYKLPIEDKPLIEFKEAIRKFGKSKTQYKLRDWVFSRQRYWGEPIPIIHCDTCGVVPVPEKDLPVLLPEVKEYEPTGTGESPLAAIKDWVNVKCPNCDGNAKRETNTMPQWAGSSWYWLRYADAHNDKTFADKKKLKHWQPVDVYFGGMEHTTLHLLYSRFWNQFLYDQGLVTVSEPYVKRVPHGIVLAEDGEKMSKSRGNVVNPDEVVKTEGADALRMHEMFLGPHEASVSWNGKGILGITRFLEKVWKFALNDDAQENKAIHKLIKKVTSDIEQYKFNTAIASFMEFLNNNKTLNKSDWENFLILLAPFAPHMTEEIWHDLGHKDSIHIQAWPKFDEKLIKDDKVTIVVQILGKTRTILEAAAGSSQEEVKEIAFADENIKKHLEGKQIIKEIFVKDKLINFVVK